MKDCIKKTLDFNGLDLYYLLIDNNYHVNNN